MVMDRKEARKVVAAEVRRVLTDRTYDRHAADSDIFDEGVLDVTDSVLNALNWDEVSEAAWMYEDLRS